MISGDEVFLHVTLYSSELAPLWRALHQLATKYQTEMSSVCKGRTTTRSIAHVPDCMTACYSTLLLLFIVGMPGLGSHAV